MGLAKVSAQNTIHTSGKKDQYTDPSVAGEKSIIKVIITFNSASLSMYTCLAWSSPSSYSQVSVSSSFNDRASRSYKKEKQLQNM